MNESVNDSSIGRSQPADRIGPADRQRRHCHHCDGDPADGWPTIEPPPPLQQRQQHNNNMDNVNDVDQRHLRLVCCFERMSEEQKQIDRVNVHPPRAHETDGQTGGVLGAAPKESRGPVLSVGERHGDEIAPSFTPSSAPALRRPSWLAASTPSWQSSCLPSCPPSWQSSWRRALRSLPAA